MEAMDETNENMEKDKIIDNGNIISWYTNVILIFALVNYHYKKKMRGKKRQNFRYVLN